MQIEDSLKSSALSLTRGRSHLLLVGCSAGVVFLFSVFAGLIGFTAGRRWRRILPRSSTPTVDILDSAPGAPDNVKHVKPGNIISRWFSLAYAGVIGIFTSGPDDVHKAEKLVIKDVTVVQSGPNFYSDHLQGAYSIGRGKSSEKRAYVINIKTHPTCPREGTDIDRNNLTELFRQLGFDVTTFNDHDDLSKQGFAKHLGDIAKDVSSKSSECLVLFVLSHGDIEDGDEVISCSDGKSFKKNDIISCFNDEHCPQLIGKPRLIFLASCRGRERQYAEDALTVPKDFYIGLPCQEGYTSIRDQDFGTRYIRAIVYVFMKKAKDTHLNKLMDEVKNTLTRMIERNPESGKGLTQTIDSVNNLQKLVYFFP